MLLSYFECESNSKFLRTKHDDYWTGFFSGKQWLQYSPEFKPKHWIILQWVKKYNLDVFSCKPST